MLSKTLVAASTKPLVLTVLKNGENYGYQIIQSVRRISGGQLDWSEPMLYPLLQRMEKEGLVKFKWKVTGNKRLRKYYRLTEKGIREQEREAAQWSMINEFFGRVLGTEPTSGI
jgi:PadR family transcriptional regulator PadR